MRDGRTSNDDRTGDLAFNLVHPRGQLVGVLDITSQICSLTKHATAFNRTRGSLAERDEYGPGLSGPSPIASPNHPSAERAGQGEERALMP